MSTTVVPDVLPSGATTRSAAALGVLAVAAFSSLAAGAIHAAAIGNHSEHRQAALAFTGLAASQLGWGAIAATKSGRRLALVGAVINAVALGGWVLAKTAGIAFISGLDVVEPVQLADGLAAALAAAAVLTSLPMILSIGRVQLERLTRVRTAGALAVGLLTLPGMVAAGNHTHAHSETAAAHDHGAATVTVVPPHPYDPTKPIDLSGVDGVTPEQQARAENLIAITLARLPQFTDPAAAEAAGFRSIGDGLTGFEHYLSRANMNDDKVLDPDFPESVVYRVINGQRTLQAAMFMLNPGDTLETVPDVGGKLMQWHIHNNLCFTPDPAAPRVAGLTGPDGSCAPPLVQGVQTPMVHVWIVPQRCGPFAALEGIGGGQVKAGEVALCDHVHGG